MMARSLNDRLLAAERTFCDGSGLPGRSWFKNVVFSPGEHNAYGSEKFPSLTAALDEGDAAKALLQLDVVVRHILGAASVLRGGGSDGGVSARWSCRSAFGSTQRCPALDEPKVS